MGGGEESGDGGSGWMLGGGEETGGSFGEVCPSSGNCASTSCMFMSG